MRKSIEIWHNILWSQYKAVVLSEIYRQAEGEGVTVKFYQIAETENNRTGLSGVNLDRHEYPFVQLFKGDYYKVNRFRLAWALCSSVAKSRADLTILTSYNRLEYWLQLLVLVVQRRKRAVFCDATVFDNRQTLIRGLAKRIFFNLCDGVFCYGTRASEYVSLYGVPQNRVIRRCQAAALSRDYDAASVPKLRHAARNASTGPRYLFVGRLAPEKSLDTLLHAMVEVIVVDPSARLVVVGSGPEESNLKSLSVRLGIGDNVEFCGSKSGEALWNEYLSASCLVLPSYSEPWGLVVNEALAYGCPVVVSDRCGCVPELVIEGLTGFKFVARNSKELAGKLLLAQRTFADVEAVAGQCVAHIAPYSPAAAAKSIIAGSKQLLLMDAH